MKNYISGNSAFAGMLAAALIFATPMTVNAADTYDSGDWEYSANIYMWMSSLKAETNSGVDIEIDIETLLDNLKMAFMGGLEGRNGKWSLFSDLLYLNVGGSKSATVVGDGPFGLYQDRKASIGLKSWIITLAGGYNYIDTEMGRLDIIAGTRYFYLQEELGLKVNVGSVKIFDRSITVSDYVWDALIGVKGHVNVDANWYIPYYFDIGSGGSDLTLQAMAGVGYRFDWGDVLLTYRHIHYDYKSDFPNTETDMSGLLLGATFHF